MYFLEKKEFCEIGEEAIWESRFTSFFNFLKSTISNINMYPLRKKKKNRIAYEQQKKLE